MIPGELKVIRGTIELNVGRKGIVVVVINCGDRPIQVGSHFHFYEVNNALQFNRIITLGFRLDIISGTAIRFEPGQIRSVNLVQYAGRCKVFSFL